MEIYVEEDGAKAVRLYQPSDSQEVTLGGGKMEIRFRSLKEVVAADLTETAVL